MLTLADQNPALPSTAANIPEQVSCGWRPAALFLLCVAAAALMAGFDTSVRLSVLRAATQIQTAEAPSAELPGERSTIFHGPAIDARWWVIHAEEATRKGAWRIRETKLDNAPDGREVHWNSGPIWMLRAMAVGISVFSGRPAAREVQEAALWFGPSTMAFGFGLLAILMGRRFGWGYAGLLVLLLTTSLPVYGNFRAGEPDHHGAVLVFLLGSVLSLVAGGAGIVQCHSSNRSTLASVVALKPASRYFALSGLLGSAGMWISAATSIPVLTGCGLGALAAAILQRKNQEENLKFVPERWNTWAHWGAAGCLAFYLLEYFPSRMGWRLEVNHPLYALAWLGAGEILSLLCAWAGGAAPTRSFAPRLLVALLCLAVPVLLIVLAASRVFWVADPFLLALHKNHIREFGPLLEAMASRGDFSDWLDYFAWPFFAILGGGMLLWSKTSTPWPSLLAVAFTPAALMQVLGFAQVRWEGIAVGLWGACAVLVVLAFCRGSRLRRIPWVLPVGLALLAVAALVVFPQLVVRRFLDREEIAANLPQELAPVVLLRDVAHRLVQSSPTRTPVVLSDPTTSTELAYFGGIGVFGTLYWENLQGLEKSAWLFTAPDEKTSRERFASAGVTHLVLPSWDDFTAVAFLSLLQGSGKAPLDQKTLYLDAVMRGPECPQWLRPHYYAIPATFGLSQESIRVFEVRFDQSVFDSWLHWAEYFVNAEDYAAAQRLLEKAREADPSNPDVTRWLAAVSQKAKTTQPQKSKVP